MPSPAKNKIAQAYKRRWACRDQIVRLAADHGQHVNCAKHTAAPPRCQQTTRGIFLPSTCEVQIQFLLAREAHSTLEMAHLPGAQYVKKFACARHALCCAETPLHRESARMREFRNARLLLALSRAVDRPHLSIPRFAVFFTSHSRMLVTEPRTWPGSVHLCIHIRGVHPE